MPEVKCESCGTENTENSKFCRNCGKKLSGLHNLNTSDNIVSKNKNTEKILIGLVVLLVIAIAVVGIFAFMTLNNNHDGAESVNTNGNSNLANIDNNVDTVTSSSISLSEVYGLAQAFCNQINANNMLNDYSIQYKGVTLTKQQCLYIFSKAIDMKNKGIDGDIHFKSFGPPASPLNSVNTNYLTKSEYVNMAQRTVTWMDNHGQAPNYTGIIVAGSPDFGYSGLVMAFAIVILQSGNGYLPSSISW